jgi:hypothetical protein
VTSLDVSETELKLKLFVMDFLNCGECHCTVGIT